MKIETGRFSFLLKTDRYGQIQGTYDHEKRTWRGDIDLWKVTAAAVAGLLLAYGLIAFPALAVYGGVSYKLVCVTAFLNCVLAKYAMPEKCFQIGELPNKYVADFSRRLVLPAS